MEKTFRFKSIIQGYIIIVLLLSLVNCKTNNFWRQVDKNRTFANKIYDKYLKAYGKKIKEFILLEFSNLRLSLPRIIVVTLS